MATPLLAFSVRAYRRLLRCYPRWFRDAHGHELEQAFRDQYRAAYHARGILGVLALWPRSIIDVLRTALAERITNRDPLRGRTVHHRRRRPHRRSMGALDGIALDIRYALRGMQKRPGLTAAVVVTLALGFGANAAMFTVVNGVVVRALPFADPDRLVALQRIRPNGSPGGQLSWPDVVTLRERSEVFRGVAGYSATPMDLMGVEEPERIEVARVTARFFELFGGVPQIGRLFVDNDHGRNGRRVAVLSHASWRRRFGTDPGVLGRAVTLDDRSYTVVGVLGAESAAFPDAGVELWIPTASNWGWGAFWLTGLARLRDGVTLDDARAELAAVQRGIEAEHPELYAKRSFTITGLRDFVVGDVTLLLLVQLGAVGLVLVIATANVANLFFARAAERRREIAMRTALGSSTPRLARQLVTESLLLSAVGGVLGVLAAKWVTDLWVAFGPPDLPRRTEIGQDASVWLFAMGLALVVGVVFGLAPLAHARAGQMHDALRDGAPAVGAGRAGCRIRHFLVGVQIALSCTLLIGAGLLGKSLWRLLRVDPGFRAENVLSFRVSTPASAFPDRDAIYAVHRELREALGALPSVQQVASASLIPFHGGNWCNGLRLLESGEAAIDCAEFRTATPGYFRLMGLSLLGGRVFREADDAAAPKVAVVNRTAARLAWGSDDPIGKRFGMLNQWWQVVGVVSDVRHFALDRDVVPAVYMPQSQAALRYARYVLRTAEDPTALIAAVRSRVWTIDPRLPLAEFATLESLIGRTVSAPRFRVGVLGAIGLLATTLSAVGVFAVMAHSVSQETRDIGVRMALGAGRGNVVHEMMWRGAAVVLLGVGSGGVAAVGGARVLRGFLFGVAPIDPAVFAVAAVIVTGVGLLACWLPARRAASVDPVVALRWE